MTGASNVKDGDIVQVDKKGRRFYAIVTGRTEAKVGKTLMIRPLTRETYTTAASHEVIGIYRKAKGSA